MILMLIKQLEEKHTDLTPQKAAPELRCGEYKGANIFGEDVRFGNQWVEVDSTAQYDYLCFGSIDYDNIHNRNYDRFN